MSNAVRKDEAVETVVAVLPKLKEEAMTTQEEELVSEVTEIEARAGAVVIVTDQDYEAAGEFGVLLKQRLVRSPTSSSR